MRFITYVYRFIVKAVFLQRSNGFPHYNRYTHNLQFYSEVKFVTNSKGGSACTIPAVTQRPLQIRQSLE